MKIKNNYLILFIIIILIVFGFFISSSCASDEELSIERDFINISDDGVLKFNTTGFNCENNTWGFEDNKLIYNLTDDDGRWAELTIHHSSMDDLNSLEVEYMHAEFYRPWGMWIGNYSGDYYSVIVTESSDDSYFDSEFVNNRIIHY